MRLFYCTELHRARGLAALGSCHGFAALDLRAPAAFGQISGSLLPRRVARLNVVDYIGCACRMGQASGGALVLQHVGVSCDRRASALDVYLELVFVDFRIGEARTNRLFDLGIGLDRVGGRRM